jgi:hypothetical protein
MPEFDNLDITVCSRAVDAATEQGKEEGTQLHKQFSGIESSLAGASSEPSSDNAEGRENAQEQDNIKQIKQDLVKQLWSKAS